jgi:hypothetical protein
MPAPVHSGEDRVGRHPEQFGGVSAQHVADGDVKHGGAHLLGQSGQCRQQFGIDFVAQHFVFGGRACVRVGDRRAVVHVGHVGQEHLGTALGRAAAAEPRVPGDGEQPRLEERLGAKFVIGLERLEHRLLDQILGIR